MFNRPDYPTRIVDLGTNRHLCSCRSRDYPRSRGRWARSKSRSCAWSLTNDVTHKESCTRDKRSWTRNIRAPKAMSSSTTDSLIYRESINCSSNSINTIDPSNIEVHCFISLTLLCAFILRQYTYLNIGAGLSAPPDATFSCRYSERRSIRVNH
jgi:hypothetical protein